MLNKAATCPEIKEKSLQLHKAPILEHLEVKLRSRCPDDADVGKLILNAVERYIRLLDFDLKWNLALSNKILIELPSEVLLPSLKKLNLICVVYKDEDSLVKLRSSCHVLKTLVVVREKNDNVIKFSVKVPSLNSLVYINNNDDDGSRRWFSPNENFLTYLSSVKFLHMTWIDETEVFCSCVNYSQLIECMLRPCRAEYWVESVMLLLDNSPNLKVLMIDTKGIGESDDLRRWSYVPECLSSQLEILEWKKYGGTRDEKQLLEYILASSSV
ncbi:hypothetical protein Bca52824_063708 [Brassica carinata]|uniref:FBD domain-containing protein n=1 Tax=Brassica carinata TaxID=52824 RepID=A0A8X7QG63_BRACI|nr:hypothetical protein Bca52824_063708 [Brassica carinata]